MPATLKQSVKSMVVKPLRWAARRVGYDVAPLGYREVPRDLRDGGTGPDIFEQVKPFTMTSLERVVSLIHAVDFIVRRGIPGGIVECGVWKGGSMMAIALMLQRLGVTDRDLYLFDTFEGMPQPADNDTEWDHQNWRKNQKDGYNEWCLARLDEVKQNVASTGYPMQRVHFVKGMVEDTIPAEAPEAIALLRLDTDWYESTKHELDHLYPRLSRHGMLIVDDYFLAGCTRAVDEYFGQQETPMFLSRIDYTGRIGMKP